MVIHDITDHYPTFLFTDIGKKASHQTHNNKTKVINEKTLAKLKSYLQNKSWTTLDRKESNEAYDLLIKEINEAILATIPEKTMSTKPIDQTPWLTKGILKSIKQKNKLFIKYRKKNNDLNKETYTTYRNKLSHIIRKSKKDYYGDLIAAAQGVPKKMESVK